VIAGDGIGREILPAATHLLDSVSTHHGFKLRYQRYPWGCDYYKEVGSMMPADGLGQLAASDAILLGAVGAPDVPDHISLWGLLIPIRRGFEQYVNLRPVRRLEGVGGPLAARGDAIDFVIVRENCEGEYSQVGGRMYSGTDQEVAVQSALFSRLGIKRIVDYAVDLAQSRRGGLVSATKSNGIFHSMPFWDEVCRETCAARGMEVSLRHVDALAADLVLRPANFDVIVASNLFGDILSDLGAALTGSIGLAPSANLNPSGAHPSMFEPIHGSAPDIAGRGIANPTGQIWAASMMLDHLGEPEAGEELLGAVEATLAESGVRTPDLGGTASTAEYVKAVEERLHERRRGESHQRQAQ
jgi:tartrate dehydrogenase/decarboxylase/D-malate dehydrogenase